MIDSIQRRGWVKIETAADMVAAQLLMGMLQEQDIPAVTEPGTGRYRKSLDLTVDVFVAAKNEKRARELISEYFDQGFTDKEELDDQ